MLASIAGDTVAYWAAILGKILLLLAGMAVLLDLIGPDRLSRWRCKAERRRERTGRHRTLIRGARRIEALTRRMARQAARKVSLPPEDLAYLKVSADQFEAWTRDAHAELSARGQDLRGLGPDFTMPRFEPLARRSLFWNDRVPRAERLGLRMIHHDFGTRGRRSWKLGQALFGFALAAAGILICLGNERNPVVLGSVILGVGWLAMVIWAGLRSPAIMLGFMRAEATVRFRLAHGAWTLIGRDGKGHPMRWAALVAFLVGSFLDLAASL